MNGITGQEDINIGKEDFDGLSGSQFASKTLIFAHESVGNELSISLNSLVAPQEYLTNGFNQPSVTDLVGARLGVFRSRLKLYSSIGGRLHENDSYKVTTSSTIQFIGLYKELGGLREGEIIVGYVEQYNDFSKVITDARVKHGTVVVLAGQKEVPLPVTFKYNENESEQLGAVKIHYDGKLLLRNEGNIESDLNDIGNYSELDGGDGLATGVRLNVAFGAPIVLAYEIGVISSSADAEVLGQIEALQGQVLAIAQDVAEQVFGEETATRYLTAPPTTTDRVTFGKRLWEIISLAPSFLTKLKAVFGITYWQLKRMSSNTSAIGVIPSLTFNNLEIGKTYRVLLHVNFQGTGQKKIRAENGVAVVAVAEMSAGSTELNQDVMAVFTASDTILTFFNATSNSQIQGGGSDNEGTFAILEELPNHIETTKWS